MADKTPTIKRSIKPVTITITVKAHKINENGTFSQFEVEKISGPNKLMKVSQPFQGGGSLYIKTETLENITVLEDGTKSSVVKPKLF